MIVNSSSTTLSSSSSSSSAYLQARVREKAACHHRHHHHSNTSTALTVAAALYMLVSAVVVQQRRSACNRWQLRCFTCCILADVRRTYIYFLFFTYLFQKSTRTTTPHICLWCICGEELTVNNVVIELVYSLSFIEERHRRETEKKGKGIRVG